MFYPPGNGISFKEVMDMTPEQIILPQKLTLSERKELNMTGVTEVVSFDDTGVILQTSLGTLEIQGQQLQLKNLSLEGGQVSVSGHICALYYEEPKSTAGFWGRLLK